MLKQGEYGKKRVDQEGFTHLNISYERYFIIN
jgi:hypothetical protein